MIFITITISSSQIFSAAKSSTEFFVISAKNPPIVSWTNPMVYHFSYSLLHGKNLKTEIIFLKPNIIFIWVYEKTLPFFSITNLTFGRSVSSMMTYLKFDFNGVLRLTHEYNLLKRWKIMRCIRSWNDRTFIANKHLAADRKRIVNCILNWYAVYSLMICKKFLAHR